jgi:hypothetical protein
VTLFDVRINVLNWLTLAGIYSFWLRDRKFSRAVK